MSTEERSVNQPEEQPSLSEQRLIRRAKLKELQDAGQDPFQITKFVVKHHSADIKEGFEALEGAMTSVAGRIMSKRGMGKAVFCDLQDGKGRIQLYVRVDELGEEAFAKFKKTDIGDIVGVEGEVYEIGRILRTSSMDAKHNPEFTTIELYEAYADFHDMMDIAEGVLSTAAKEILGSYRVTWLGNEIDLTPGWKRMTMIDAVREYVGVDFEAISDDEEACKAAEAKGIDLEGCERTWGTALYEAFDQRVEEKLIQPTFITMYPVEVSPLTKRSPKDPRLTERFELFINHCEFANAFSELNDPIDQRGRFEHELALREMGNDEAGMMDEDFINALEYGLPPTGGMGIGIDRCVMLLTDSDSIRDVILFPTMKPLDSDKKVEKRVEAPAEATQAAPEVEEKIDFSNVQIEPLFQDQVDFDTFSKSDFRAVKVKECEAVKKSKKLLKFVLDDGTGVDRVILSGIHEYYEPEELVGKTCIAITNLPPRAMMGIDSCGMLISAVHHENGEEKLHLLMVDPHIPAGAKLY